MNDEFTTHPTPTHTDDRPSPRSGGRRRRRPGRGGHMHHHHDHPRAEHDRGGRGGRHRARRGAVPIAIFTLLDERPMHGYEIITELESRSDGRWRPSPGPIYPALDRLEDHGALSSTEVDGKRQFRSPTAVASAWPRSRKPRATTRVEPWNQSGHRRPRRHAAPDVGTRWPGPPDRPIRHVRTTRGRDRALEDTKRKLYAILARSDQPDAD